MSGTETKGNKSRILLACQQRKRKSGPIPEGSENGGRKWAQKVSRQRQRGSPTSRSLVLPFLSHLQQKFKIHSFIFFSFASSIVASRAQFNDFVPTGCHVSSRRRPTRCSCFPLFYPLFPLLPKTRPENSCQHPLIFDLCSALARPLHRYHCSNLVANLMDFSLLLLLRRCLKPGSLAP